MRVKLPPIEIVLGIVITGVGKPGTGGITLHYMVIHQAGRPGLFYGHKEGTYDPIITKVQTRYCRLDW